MSSSNTQKLISEKQRLINEIKTKHSKAYEWLVQNDFDFNNVRKYSVEIAAALIFVSALIQNKALSDTQKNSNTVRVTEIQKSELINLTESGRAELVFYRYGPLITQTAEKYNVDPKLILATIMSESTGDAKAVRYEPSINDSSYGLGQILYGTAKTMGFNGAPSELYNPTVNIDLIGKYHRRNLDVYGEKLTLDQIATAYNAGNPYAYPHYGYLEKIRKWFNIINRIVG